MKCLSLRCFSADITIDQCWFQDVFDTYNIVLIPCYLETNSTLERSVIDGALSTIKGAYWEIDYRTKEENLSSWFLESLGYKPTNFTKVVQFREIVHKEDHHRLDLAWKKFARSKYKSEFDCTFKYRTKRDTLVEIWARGKVVEFDKNGKPLKFVGIQLNVSKIRKVNEDLQRITKIIYKQNKEIKDFSSIASHNLRSPMSNLLSLVNFYKLSKTEQERTQIFEMIQKASNKLADVIDDLGNILSIVAVPDSSQVKLDFEEAWNRVKSLLLADITDLNIKFEFSLRALTISYSKTYLDSILLNFLTNSIKYRDQSRQLKIKIDTWTVDGKVWMTYEDNGIGIDLERFGQKIFGYGKTFHVHPEAKGIGLFITKLQIESMGGHIEVDSKVGEWTKFTVCFYA